MSKAILMTDPSAIGLVADPIRRDWIIAGTPEASAKILVRSKDWICTIAVWECTAGVFHWKYTKDEVLFVLSGEATITSEAEGERRFGPGDVVFFPAGSSCTWLIRDHVRKVAVVRDTLWLPLGIGVKVWNKLRRVLTPRTTRGSPISSNHRPLCG
jgi:hypothetical protein